MIPFRRRRRSSQTFRWPCRCNLHSTPAGTTTQPNVYVNAKWIFWIAGEPRVTHPYEIPPPNHALKITPALDYVQSLQSSSGMVSANLHSSGRIRETRGDRPERLSDYQMFPRRPSLNVSSSPASGLRRPLLQRVPRIARMDERRP